MKIVFLSPVQHDDKEFGPGDKADISAKAAQALIAAGAAETQQAADERAAALAAEQAAADAAAQAAGDGNGHGDTPQG